MRPVASLLLLLVSLLLSWLLLRLAGTDWRQGILRAAVIFGLCVVGLTEGLSAAHALTARALTVSWVAVDITLLVLTIVMVRRRRPLLIRFHFSARGVGVLDISLMIAIAVVLITESTVAAIVPPSNWDSMTYHLPRVMRWLQQGDLSYYRTAINRQLYLPPMAEYLLAHLRALAGNDRLLSLPQAAAAAACVAGTSRIAGSIGAGRRAQLLTGLTAATIPIAVLEATNTQNDLLAALWTVAAVDAVVSRLASRRKAVPAGGGQLRAELAPALQLGGALALCALTKPTAALAAVPFVLWWAFEGLRSQPRATLVAGAGVILLVAVVNAPHTSRNLRTFGAPLGPPTAQVATNAALTPALVSSNIVRDLASNLATPVPHFNANLNGWVRGLDTTLGISADDPRNTAYAGSQGFALLWKVDEDFAPNGVTVLLVLLGTAASLVRRTTIRRGRAQQRWFCVAYLTGAVLFAATLRWQPSLTRLELPLLMLGAVPVGLLFDRQPALTRRGGMVGAAPAVVSAALLVWTGGWFLINNETRPLIGPRSVFTTGRYDLMMAKRPWLRKPFRELAAGIRRSGAYNVGLAQTSDDWEYPLWALLGAPRAGLRLYSVTPGSDTLPGTAQTPATDLVACTDVRHVVCARFDHKGYRIYRYGAGVFRIYAR